MATPLSFWGPFRVLGAILTIGGAIVLVSVFARLVMEGIGTPAPIAPTRHLVVGGLYRYVRNPMYIAVVAEIIGQALLLGQLGLLLYARGVHLSVRSDAELALGKNQAQQMPGHFSRARSYECHKCRYKCRSRRGGWAAV